MSKGKKEIRREMPKHVLAFETWFSVGKDFALTAQVLRQQTPPLNISTDTVYRWCQQFRWDERAAEREAAVQQKLMESSIQELVEFQKRKATYGKLLQRRSLEYLQRQLGFTDTLDENGNPVKVPILHVTNAATAVQVLQAGVQLEQQALGLPDWVTEALSADEETLRRVYETALGELARATGANADEGDTEEAFPSVVIEPVSPASKST